MQMQGRDEIEPALGQMRGEVEATNLHLQRLRVGAAEEAQHAREARRGLVADEVRLLNSGERVISFPVSEYWLDIGQKSDYARAQSDMAAGHV